MANNTTVTMVRLYIPESSHSTRKMLMEKVLHLLHDQLVVHGITILTGMSEPGPKQELPTKALAICYGGIWIRRS
jgi:hypothetical protein